MARGGRRGWIALTHDKRIRYKPNERDAVMRHRVGLLVIVGAAPFADLAHAFLATLPSVEHFLDIHEPPFIARFIGRHRMKRRGAGFRRDVSNSGIRANGRHSTRRVG